MTSKQTSYGRRVVNFIGSSLFFKLTVGALTLQAAWIALSSRYPMAYDEDYHLGVIQLYANHMEPFWHGQTAGPAVYGAVTRDPSYLYHYLMGLPYQLISWLTDNQAVQVLFLRGINIVLFVLGLILFRRLLLMSRASRTKVHAVLAVFTLIPIVPFLAAQINYDNLFLPLTAAALLMTARVGQKLRQQQTLRPCWLLGLVILCLLGGLVKFAFLPIALAIFIYLAVCLKRAYPGYKAALSSFKIGWRSIRPLTQFLLVLGLIISSWLFVERYGINAVRYHALVPACDQVLSVEQCSAYGPWSRDYNLSLNKAPDSSSNPAVFTGYWFYGMWLRSFFAVAGPDNHFATRGPLTLPGLGAIALAATGGLAALAAGRRLLISHDGTVITLYLLVSAFYIVVLWLQEYQAFVRTAEPVAINGRYLLPVLPMLMLLGVLGLRRLIRLRAAVVVLAVAVVCLLWGGGALTYILRSEDSWYWQNDAVRAANHAVQHVLGPVTPGYNSPNQFMRWN